MAVAVSAVALAVSAVAGCFSDLRQGKAISEFIMDNGGGAAAFSAKRRFRRSDVFGEAARRRTGEAAFTSPDGEPS
jgi:hypothetical protein